MKAVRCAFLSPRDDLDLSTPAGRMMFRVIGEMAEFEREMIRERVRARLAHARAKTQKLGRAQSSARPRQGRKDYPTDACRGLQLRRGYGGVRSREIG